MKSLVLYRKACNMVYCCGSGSHCFVAKNLGRKYVGVELDKDYFDVAIERIGG